MKNILILILSLSIFSCDEGNFFEVPINNEQGEYQYVSNSDYFDIKGVQYNSATNQGIIIYNEGQQAIQMTPLLGWEYYLQMSNLTEHTLTDGSIAITFRINLQEKEVSEARFTVRGTNDIELKDGETIIDTADGVIYIGDRIEFGIESFNIYSTEKSITYIEGTRRN